MKNLSLFLLLLSVVHSIPAQDDLLLKDFRPESIYNTSNTVIERAKYPVIDFHAHPNAATVKELEEWVSTMKGHNIEKSIILTYSTGRRFDSIYDMYAQYGAQFELWCGFDYTGYNEPGWTKKAIKELERCFAKGARGVGELGDKGLGLFYSKPSEAPGLHIDDPRIQPLLKRCGELGMPVSVHVADPYWMYLPMNERNDGLMNAYTWKIDQSKKGLLSHQELLTSLSNAVKNNRGTTFIACHLANCSHDLEILGKLLDEHPNLYADISARYAEVAPVPRRTKRFFEEYKDRLVYGTDMGMDDTMYRTTFKILESADEHFYAWDYFSYHWPLNGLDLNDETLKKIYHENGRKLLKR
ncbi:Predicted metal-dependent hydrolase, TIM-barrel fold [Zobellia uliginosa]|uniref:Predicted metal-dependent hydrolase, TIM-barrel fold n=1 Tax=Zobellia uliginosa TaxID=143224 RepID=A0ABY1KHT7_9FLAO|nr:amidohydrolase family protein [Zobellia uliginosa]SIS37293.1 Predicted metal-dependent hydrolase, TIM-barrel fold [Zobellia uliginosa]